MNPSIIRNTIFRNNLRLYLIRPINFEYGMIMSHNQQELIVQIVTVNTKSSKARISAISSFYYDSLR